EGERLVDRGESGGVADAHALVLAVALARNGELDGGDDGGPEPEGEALVDGVTEDDRRARVSGGNDHAAFVEKGERVELARPRRGQRARSRLDPRFDGAVLAGGEGGLWAP